MDRKSEAISNIFCLNVDVFWLYNTKVTCASAVAVSNDAQGSMIAVAVQEVIYVWMAASGKMVTVIDSGKPSTYYYTHVIIK